MEYKLDHGSAYTVLKITLQRGDEVYAEPGAMMLMEGVEVQTSMRGGFIQGLMRSMMGGESVWVNTYRAQRDGARVWFVPSGPGDITYVPLNGQSLVIQDRAYLAHHGEVSLGVAFRGWKGFLAEGELVWLKAEGHGGVWISAIGALEEMELHPEERVTVDNFHLVAMDGNIRYDIRKFGGIRSMILGGEGLVVEVTGPGRIIVQSRTGHGLAEALIPFLPKRG